MTKKVTKKTGVFMNPAYVAGVEAENQRLNALVEALKRANEELACANREINNRLGRQLRQNEQHASLDHALCKIRDAISEFQNDYPTGSIRL